MPASPDTPSDEHLQAEVRSFLERPETWPGRPDRIKVVETHAALVFLGGDEVLKIKRAVRMPYLDYSTLEARRRACDAEIAINQPQAPEIYLDVIAITREPDGRLALGGTGPEVEWAVRMRRFPDEAVLLSLARREGIGLTLAGALADAVIAYHRAARVRIEARSRLPDTARRVLDGLAGHATAEPLASAVRRCRAAAERQIGRAMGILDARAAAGSVRRCHGDLHLNNIVLWQGRPTPFDALEFDEALATVDVLYDLAFLLMDLERNHCTDAAALVLNRYLWRSGTDIDLDGLAALPLCLGTRAAIRALVALDRGRVGAEARDRALAHALDTLAFAERCLTPPLPRLVAVGGLSGTGKTRLAAALAPHIAPLPGALHLRTDLERKWLAGVDELDRLPPASYTAEASAAVYARVMARAKRALDAGHSVIIDAVSAAAAERNAIERLARDRRVSFSGIWLQAPAEVLKARVASRTSDASDATVEVVERQLGRGVGTITWTRIDASTTPEATLGAALAVINPPARDLPSAD